jgi:hypothetical protein
MAMTPGTSQSPAANGLRRDELQVLGHEQVAAEDDEDGHEHGRQRHDEGRG